MAKKHHVICEKTEKSADPTSTAATVAKFVINPLLVLTDRDTPEYTTRIRTDDNREYVGKGSSPDASKGAAYAKMPEPK